MGFCCLLCGFEVQNEGWKFQRIPGGRENVRSESASLVCSSLIGTAYHVCKSRESLVTVWYKGNGLNPCKGSDGRSHS